MNHKLFPNRKEILNPVVVDIGEDMNGNPKWGERVAPGKHYVVTPSSIREISALRMMEHRVDKFALATRKAPNSGGTVVVSAEALAKLDA